MSGKVRKHREARKNPQKIKIEYRYFRKKHNYNKKKTLGRIDWL